MTTNLFEQAAEYIAQADALIITAGAGMGVDSGLPDFRGAGGFWKAYPALADAQLSFEEIATPEHFYEDPTLAWGFYGHRLALYRRTVPHAGFALLRKIGQRLRYGVFIFTSNVDGHFQKAGFDESRIVECHGSINWLQCLSPGCNDQVWPADSFRPQVDFSVCRLRNRPPICPRCGGVSRPNILMFNDWNWIDQRAVIQRDRLADWMGRTERLVTIELGAGTTVATVRRFGNCQSGAFIRINPTDEAVGKREQGVGIRTGALDGVAGIHGALKANGFFGEKEA